MNFNQSRIASRAIAALSVDDVNMALLAVADALEARSTELLDANASDLERMDEGDAR